MSDDIRYESRMSDTDALMWTIEKDPLLRSTITIVTLLDQPPDRDRLADKVERATRIVPRLRQRVVGNPFALAPPRWEIDPDFDLRYHARWVKAPGDGSVRAVLDLAQWVGMQGFDRARPLWEFYVIDGVEGGRGALIQKVHHAVTDGVGSIKIALAILDFEADPGDLGEMPEVPVGETMGPLERFVDSATHVPRRQLGIASRTPATVGRGLQQVTRDPAGAARSAGEAAASVWRLLKPVTHPLSPIMTERSRSVRYELLTRPLDDLRRAAKAAECRVNDAFLAAVGGGFRRYHETLGATVTSLRVTMPINIRDDETEALAGNRFVPARFPIPVDIDDPVQRMQTIRELVQHERAEPALSLVDPVAGILNRMPATLTTAVFGSMLKGVDLVASNVPGAPIPLYLAGALVQQQFAFGPLSGAAANVTLVSWGSEVCVGVNLDRAAVSDPALMLECLEAGFDEILDCAPTG
jgi:diacylglycerol O-acyltransferase / wax synthase